MFKVLIIEDDLALSEILASVVSEAGASVRVVDSVDAGLKVFKDNPGISLIITDVVTSGWLNGFDFVKEVHKTHPSMPVILTSGYNHYEHPNVPPNVHLLPKPWTLDQVSSIVAQLGLVSS